MEKWITLVKFQANLTRARQTVVGKCRAVARSYGNFQPGRLVSPLEFSVRLDRHSAVDNCQTTEWSV